VGGTKIAAEVVTLGELVLETARERGRLRARDPSSGEYVLEI
jgi:hypothetical protein